MLFGQVEHVLCAKARCVAECIEIGDGLAEAGATADVEGGTGATVVIRMSP
jgi:hypothetical protein